MIIGCHNFVSQKYCILIEINKFMSKLNGKIIWIDKTRANSPPLILNDINLSYSTSDILSYLDRHLFYLDFFSSAGTKEKGARFRAP